MMSGNCQLRTIVSAYTVIILFGSSSCLKIVGVEVPSLADFRLPATLDCSYDTGQDALYSVKWYKDDHELFRYMPSNTPSVQTFPLNGAEFVISNKTDCGKTKCRITLENLTPVASGAYTCEVSLEGPTFRLVQETSNMTVTEIPPELPNIDGLQHSYTIGEILNVTCTPPASSVPPHISIYLNDKEVDENLITRKADLSDGKLYQTSARLLVTLSVAHFKSPLASESGNIAGNGALLHLRCSAAIASLPETAVSSDAVASLVAPQLLLRNQKLVDPSTGGKTLPSLFFVLVGSLLSIERIVRTNFHSF